VGASQYGHDNLRDAWRTITGCLCCMSAIQAIISDVGVEEMGIKREGCACVLRKQQRAENHQLDTQKTIVKYY